jgi:hypothetical protein
VSGSLSTRARGRVSELTDPVEMGFTGTGPTPDAVVITVPTRA